MNFDEWIAGFEDRYTEDQLWHMRWAWEVGQSKIKAKVTYEKVNFDELLLRSSTYASPKFVEETKKIVDNMIKRIYKRF